MKKVLPRFVVLLMLGALFLVPVPRLPPATAEPARAPAAGDNEELSRMYQEDQADRKPEDGKPIDWKKILPRDRAREARVKELYRSDDLETGADYYHAAMILQHSPRAEDYLLAHDFCIVAVAKGERQARWLAAASEDRFLMNIGRPQRFGTQYRSDLSGKNLRLYKVGDGVTDRLRRELGVPSLAEARKRETGKTAPPGEKK
jgi:hypothetical protein